MNSRLSLSRIMAWLLPVVVILGYLIYYVINDIKRDEIISFVYNAEVSWHHGAIGSWPEVSDRLQSCVKYVPLIKKDLFYFLGDKERYIAAHVLLTKYYFTKSFSLDSKGGWNNFYLKYANDEDLYFEQMLYLRQYWMAVDQRGVGYFPNPLLFKRP